VTDDEDVEQPAEDDGTEERTELIPEQTEKLRRAMASVQQSLIPKINIPRFTLPEAVLKNVAGITGMVEAQQQIFANAIKPMLDAQAVWQKRISGVIATDAFKNFALTQADLGRIAEQAARNLDFGGIAQSLNVVAKIGATFAEQQSALFKNLAPALEAMRANFYPPNLRAIEDLRFEAVETVVLADGIPLYGVPRTDIAEALIRADSVSKRREILGRRWRAISADCRAAVAGCASESVAPYVSFALAALNALDAGHTEAAQALAGSLVDTLVTGYFGDERYKYTPSKKTTTTDAYNEFTIREFIAFGPMWQTYQQFFVSNGDRVPGTFSRHATAHAVSTRQYNRRNAVQGVMLVCSLLYRLDEEAAALEART
jgi:hypothetical protein